MTAGFQSRSHSRGLNRLTLCSLHLSVYLVPPPSESVTGYDCIQSQGVCCLSTPGLRQSKWCTAPPFCSRTHGRHHSLTRVRGVRSAVTPKCSGVYWLWQLAMTRLPRRRWQTHRALTSREWQGVTVFGRELVCDWYNGCLAAEDNISESSACHELACESWLQEHYAYISSILYASSAPSNVHQGRLPQDELTKRGKEKRSWTRGQKHNIHSHNFFQFTSV